MLDEKDQGKVQKGQKKREKESFWEPENKKY